MQKEAGNKKGDMSKKDGGQFWVSGLETIGE